MDVINKVDADVIVIGAGIAGASIAHRCASSCPNRRVILLEQHRHDEDRLSLAKSEAAYDGDGDEGIGGRVLPNRGSSRGGPRRMGILGAGKRGREAWNAWKETNDDAVRNGDGGDADANKIWDVSGEVYVLALFPFGWLFLIVAALWVAYSYTFGDKSAIPRGFRLLLTPGAVRKKLGETQGFACSWSGCVGIYHEEAAVLCPDRIFRHLLKGTEHYEVRFGSRVADIELIKAAAGSDSPDVVQVTVSDSSKGKNSPYRLRCKHLVVACGAWTSELLKQFYQSRQQKGATIVVDPNSIQSKVDVFTCPVYKIERLDDGRMDAKPPTPPPFSLASGCPIFSCVHRGVYGFPVDHRRRPAKPEREELILSLRPFYKSHESEDPDDRKVSEEQIVSVGTFVRECSADGAVSYGHCYTCRYPKLSLDGGRSWKPVFDFIPGSGGLVSAVAGLDGYGFKFGSVYGREFLDLLETGKGPEGMEWPPSMEVGEAGRGGFFGEKLRAGFIRAIERVFASGKEESKRMSGKEE